jgi:farnesyl diphosphate synthase
MYGANEDTLIDVGSAIELIHCYSLIHDDLPAMDNDDLRRGKPTCHKQFTEAMAILSGDALQSLAFELLSADGLSLLPQRKLQIINLIAKASGVDGMAGGQAIDLLSTGMEVTKSSLLQMHILKTGSLIKASVLAGYLCTAQINQDIYDELSLVSLQLGILFQVIDDIIDVTSSTEVLGKTAKKDQNSNKATYVTIMGLKEAYNYAESIYKNIVESLNRRHDPEFLLYLTDLVYKRHQ